MWYYQMAKEGFPSVIGLTCLNMLLLYQTRGQNLAMLDLIFIVFLGPTVVGAFQPQHWWILFCRFWIDLAINDPADLTISG